MTTKLSHRQYAALHALCRLGRNDVRHADDRRMRAVYDGFVKRGAAIVTGLRSWEATPAARAMMEADNAIPGRRPSVP